MYLIISAIIIQNFFEFSYNGTKDFTTDDEMNFRNMDYARDILAHLNVAVLFTFYHTIIYFQYNQLEKIQSLRKMKFKYV